MSKRVLLDENMPHRLRFLLTGHTVMTVMYQGWSTKQNGELIALAEADAFDVLVTADKNLSYQQNMRSRRLALVVLGSNPRGTNRRSVILANASRILAAVDAAQPYSYTLVSMDGPGL